MTFLSVILPVRNQRDHIREVLLRWLELLADHAFRFEVVVVPNACTDDSGEICQAVSREDDRVRVVPLAEGGWGRAVRAGLDAASGEVLCYTNSARTEPRQACAAVERHARNPGSLVKVTRHDRGSALRQAGSFLYNLECRLILGIRAHDVNGTPKVFGRDLLARCPLESNGDLIDAELLARCARAGIPIIEIPVTGWKRHGGRSSTGLSSAWGMYAGAWKLRSRLGG